MNPTIRKFLYPFLLPNGLLCAAIIFALQQQSLTAEWRPLLEVLPIIVAIIALLLGWRFNRTRLIYAVGLLLLAEILLQHLPLAVDQGALYQTIQLLLPFNLLLVSLFRERGLFHLHGILWLLFLAVQLLACAWLLVNLPQQSVFWLNYPLVLQSVVDLPLAQPVLLLNGLVLLSLVWRYLLKAAAFEASFFWGQLLLVVAFIHPADQPLQFYLAGIGLVLILGIMESSHSLAYLDELTGLPGRRALNEALAKLGSRYVVAMLDIDHFKKFNDTHGHDVGDQVLKMVAGRLATVGGAGKVFRYGGEEFTVVLSRKSVKAALPYLEQLRIAVEDARFVPRGKDRPKEKPKQRSPSKGKSSAALKVTISIGAAERSSDLSSSDAVLKAADQALYRAKKAGRNQVVG